MSKEDEVRYFLQDFFTKFKVFNILFRDRTDPRNAKTLLKLEITPLKRREIIESLVVADYSEGPIDDTLYGVASMWVFGKVYKGIELYIKISMGAPGSNVLCISFHEAAYPMKYPFK